MKELIISEKPKAALRIAQALANGNLKKESINKVPIYKLKHNGKEIIVAAAVGHLFGLKQKRNETIPIFDLEWRPIYEVNKEASFAKKYVNVLKKLVKDCDEITIACDYDIEGEVIGLNIIRFIANRQDANRMKFSTLTKPDLVNAYNNKMTHIDWGQANAGETRHILDWFYGINLSRALMQAIKQAGMFKIMSIGRVQGPALKLIVDKEREIKNFVAKPYWQIEFITRGIKFLHVKDKFWQEEEAKQIYEKIKNDKQAYIAVIEAREQIIKPEPAFDLTTLQTEAYRIYGINPKHTLDIAQSLYLAGLISYPRTSSQKLPSKIGYKKIIQAIAKQNSYAGFCQELLNKARLVPIQGKKTDPAHPAIYPTGLIPEKLNKYEQKIYDLIVKRFLACFAEEAIKENIKVTAKIKDEDFIFKGSRLKKKGWIEIYNFIKDEGISLNFEKGQNLTIEKLTLHKKKTEPPKRYTQATIIKELEKRHLGTKATRADIIETLYKRGYIEGKSIKATELGIKVVEILEKNSPKILDEALTRHFEDEMELIREEKKKKEDVIEEAKQVIREIIDDFTKHQQTIGEELLKATRETERQAALIGKCPSCDNDLKIIVSRKTAKQFVVCSNENCNVTFALPQKAKIEATGKICEYCKTPIVRIKRKGKKPFEMCLTINCKSKESWKK